MKTFPRTLLTDAQEAVVHPLFMALRGLCDTWIDLHTGACTVLPLDGSQIVWRTRHAAYIAAGTIRLVQW